MVYEVKVKDVTRGGEEKGVEEKGIEAGGGR